MSDLIYRFKFVWWMWRLARGRCQHCGQKSGMPLWQALRYPIPELEDRENAFDDVRTEISYGDG